MNGKGESGYPPSRKTIHSTKRTTDRLHFDSLHPPLMLNKLRAYGFAENTVNFLRSYLSNRQNRIRLGSLASSWQVVNRGCPQGSALGPLLWNIFQNDLAYEINLNLSMYADDHQIYEAGTDPANVKSSLSRNAE